MHPDVAQFEIDNEDSSEDSSEDEPLASGNGTTSVRTAARVASESIHNYFAQSPEVMEIENEESEDDSDGDLVASKVFVKKWGKMPRIPEAAAEAVDEILELTGREPNTVGSLENCEFASKSVSSNKLTQSQCLRLLQRGKGRNVSQTPRK